jgi:hypothetical protein
MTVVEDVRRARIELAKGFLFVSLANGSDSPFQREHGLALLDQALRTFEKCAAGLEAHGEDLAVFRARIKEFRANLDAAPENSDARPTPSARLRIAFHELETGASDLDDRIRRNLRALAERLDLEFRISLILSLGLLFALCVVAYVTMRRRFWQRPNSSCCCSARPSPCAASGTRSLSRTPPAGWSF